MRILFQKKKKKSPQVFQGTFLVSCKEKKIIPSFAIPSRLFCFRLSLTPSLMNLLTEPFLRIIHPYYSIFVHNQSTDIFPLVNSKERKYLIYEVLSWTFYPPRVLCKPTHQPYLSYLNCLLPSRLSSLSLAIPSFSQKVVAFASGKPNV
ncbi:hypothetical protein K457DRAFT_808698 [Linnemannia elongata AG-77]|uniref:Uncharacterized protein n=1 Tax=Linnemannia elongata AG-77 TaxID=1314771 RepID=A0A197JI68_9FUNG|nr:hypothetical protein K457DRAFT_808698 [Linnemannia elongata AG-77]